jgi:signal transduction histidine kinase/ActR/RegA family two-component response regulator
LGRFVSDRTEHVDLGCLAATLSRLADTLASATSPDEINEAALEGIRSAVAVERASVQLFDEDGTIRFKAWRGLSEDYRRAVEGSSPWRLGQAAPAPIVIGDVTTEPSLASFQSAFARENIRAVAFVPLLVRQRVIGKFVLYWAHAHLPIRSAIDAAVTIGAFVGLAVERARQNAEHRQYEARMHAALQQEAEARERLTRLAEGSQRLQSSLDSSAVFDEVLALATKAVAADAYGVWRCREGVWRVAASSALPLGFTAADVTKDERIPFTTPFVAEDINVTALPDDRRSAYAAAGIQSLVSVPLLIRGRSAGAIALYYRQPHRPSELELRILEALSQLAAAAIGSAELLAEQQASRQHALKSAERAEFLADLSARLTSLDYEQNLDAIATLIVPRFADWCVVDVLEGGELQRLAMAHTDPTKVEYAQNVLRRYPPRRDRPGGPWQVVRTGESILYENVDEAFLERASRNEEHLELLRKTGLCSLMFVPLKRGNEVFGVLWFVLADRERRYDREDLIFAEELARRAAYAIENARLYRQAQDANRAKDEFLAALSHELRTPLNAILGWASILRARPDGEIERGLDVIYRNAVVQTHLVEDLLDASRIVSGRMSIDLKDTPLRPILHAAIETILPQATEKAIEVASALPALDVLIRGDSARLQQVFWNVLSNAVKFTPRGGRISITTEVTPSEIAVHLTDTGAGIRPEALPYIFDRFKQADAATTTRRYRGLGLGLTLSRQLAEMHGGRIAAESAGPGRGSRFTVALPLVERSALDGIKTAVTVPGNSLDGIRVLAVDDDPDSLEVLVSILRTQCATVVGATSAIEALELLQKERPQIVVSDIAMPDRDGYWLMEQLRRLASEGGPNVPGVALTAFANPTVRERALATGFVAHLSKPFDPDQLVHTILNAVTAAH